MGNVISRIAGGGAAFGAAHGCPEFVDPPSGCCEFVADLLGYASNGGTCFRAEEQLEAG